MKTISIDFTELRTIVFPTTLSGVVSCTAFTVHKTQGEAEYWSKKVEDFGTGAADSDGKDPAARPHIFLSHLEAVVSLQTGTAPCVII